MKNMKRFHIKLFEEFQRDKGYLGDDIGIMYHPDLHLMYIGSSKNSKVKFTIREVFSEEEVSQIKDSLKDIDPSKWEEYLNKAGFNFSIGDEYFDLTKGTRK